MKCGGIHCDGCGRGSGGGLAAAVLLVLIIAAVKGRHVLVAAVEIAGYVLTGLAVAGAVAVIGYGAWRVRRRALQVRDRRISPQVRAVITDVRAGRPVQGRAAPGGAVRAGQPAGWQLERPMSCPALWVEEKPWEPAGYPGRVYGRSLIGDADRDWFVAMLREHYAAGRLSLEELRRRVAVVLSAVYADEAAGALTELPPLGRGAPGGER